MRFTVMKCQKGDLILITNLDGTNATCIVVGAFDGSDYLYCFCIDTNMYKLVYIGEVQAIICEKFDPEFPEDDYFDLDYSFYAACYEAYNYFPSFMGTNTDDEDDNDEE